MTRSSKSSKKPAPEPVAQAAAQPRTSGELGPSQPAGGDPAKLSQPSRELAARFLRQVEEDVWGVSEHPHGGCAGQRIFSLEEAAEFLLVPTRWNPYTNSVEPNELKKWVGETVGDTELAQAIGELTKEYDSCPPAELYTRKIELVMPLKALLQQRVRQCRELLGIETIT